MTRLLFGLLVGAVAAILYTSAKATTWVEGTTIGVRQGDVYDNTRDGNASLQLVFANSYSQPNVNQAGQWHTADVTAHNIPIDAKSVFLSGRLVITHGPSAEICDLTIAFRAPGNVSVSADDFLGQAVEAQVGGGIRSTFATWVPVVNGQFEWLWGRSGKTQWSNTAPGGCAYGVFLYPQAYVR